MINWTAINSLLILQPENPDGDSVASSLALEEIFGDISKAVTIYSYVDIPSYLGYIEGWDRIVNQFPKQFDLTVIVDTVSKSLLENTLMGDRLAQIQKKPVLVLDHHPTTNDLPLPKAEFFTGDQPVVATGEIVLKLAQHNHWPISPSAATHMLEAMLADTLGLTTEAVSAATFRSVAELAELGAKASDIDQRRRLKMQKSPKLITYKGQLLQRIEFLLNNQLALITVPWAEIEEYSPLYNPTVLALEELRNTEGVVLAVGLKIYPDGRITGKLRSNNHPLAGKLAAHFGGGGHDYAAGFKTTDWSFDDLKTELINKSQELLDASE